MSKNSSKQGEISPTLNIKPRKRSLVERELETSLTARVTSPVSLGEIANTSRYGRARRLKTNNDFCDTDKVVATVLKSPKIEKTPRKDKSPLKKSPVRINSPVYKMHALNSPINVELPRKDTGISKIENQIETIYHENVSLSRFASDEKKKSPVKKIYVRKDLIQSNEKEETVDLIKNMFSPVKKQSNSHLNNILERSSDKYNLNCNGQSLNGYIEQSVVKILDFDGSKKNKREDKDLSKKMSKSEIFEMEAKCDYQVGDLAWARMGTYPFWPCIITRETSSGLFVKKKMFGRVEHYVIHVTFFGDNGRRSWIVDNMLRKYYGQLDFEATRERFTAEAKKKDPKLYAAYFISEKKMPQWTTSVEEAEFLYCEPKRLRIDLFNDMLLKFRASKTNLKVNKSEKISRTNSDVSLSESLYDTLFSEDDSKVDEERKNKSKALDVSEVVTACLDNMAAKSGITKIQKQSHMDRWLQKAKSKTPEKSQPLMQSVPSLAGVKTDRINTGRIKKTKKLSLKRNKIENHGNRSLESQSISQDKNNIDSLSKCNSMNDEYLMKSNESSENNTDEQLNHNNFENDLKIIIKNETMINNIEDKNIISNANEPSPNQIKPEVIIDNIEINDTIESKPVNDCKDSKEDFVNIEKNYQVAETDQSEVASLRLHESNTTLNDLNKPDSILNSSKNIIDNNEILSNTVIDGNKSKTLTMVSLDKDFANHEVGANHLSHNSETKIISNDARIVVDKSVLKTDFLLSKKFVVKSSMDVDETDYSIEENTNNSNVEYEQNKSKCNTQNNTCSMDVDETKLTFDKQVKTKYSRSKHNLSISNRNTPKLLKETVTSSTSEPDVLNQEKKHLNNNFDDSDYFSIKADANPCVSDSISNIEPIKKNKASHIYNNNEDLENSDTYLSYENSTRHLCNGNIHSSDTLESTKNQDSEELESKIEMCIDNNHDCDTDDSSDLESPVFEPLESNTSERNLNITQNEVNSKTTYPSSSNIADLSSSVANVDAKDTKDNFDYVKESDSKSKDNKLLHSENIDQQSFFIEKALENSDFVQYMELRQDALLDENPELSQNDIVFYLYNTWLYEENQKYERKKVDDTKDDSNEIEKIGSTKFKKKSLSIKNKSLHENNKERKVSLQIKENLEEKNCTVVENSKTIDLLNNKLFNKKVEVLLRRISIDSIEKESNITVNKFNAQTNILHQESNASENITNHFNDIKESKSDSNTTETSHEIINTKYDNNSAISHGITKRTLDLNITKPLHDVEEIKIDVTNSAVHDSEQSKSNSYIKNTEQSTSHLDEVKTDLQGDVKCKYETIETQEPSKINSDSDTTGSINDVKESKRDITKTFHILRNTEEIKTDLETKTSQEIETASVHSDVSDASYGKRRNRPNDNKFSKSNIEKALENPDFVQYMELRQDALLDENPELSQNDIVLYLYNTWLYEESQKCERKKADDIEQSNLVKGLKTESIVQPKKMRKKKEKKDTQSTEFEEKQNIDKDVLPKNKPRRKTVKPYYNEEYDDMDFEEEMKLFEIFRKRKSHLLQKIDNVANDSINPEAATVKSENSGTDSIVPVDPQPLVTDYEEYDEVELYFEDLLRPKPNVFKGLIREKVCDICEMTSNLVKCKGCHSFFHPNCVKKQLEIVELTLPGKGRKKKKKPRGRRPKSVEGENSLDDSQSDDKCQEGNLSGDTQISIEDDPDKHVVVDLDTFESQFELKMKEVMESDKKINFEYFVCDNEITWTATKVGKCEIIDVKIDEETTPDYSDFKCNNCQKYNIPVCFVCKLAESSKGQKNRQKCSVNHCQKYYHLGCLDHWPQTQFSSGEPSKSRKNQEASESITCPRHVCHTCVSDNPRGCKTRFSGDKLARCIRCPATYHTFTKCLPAGSQILSGSHIICPRHYEHRPGKVPCHVNTGWCFICALGGSLICCEYCPTSFHAECLNISPPEGGYMCEDCETGRLPLYGEMVWVKLGHYRWWPGLILHPCEIPENIMAVKHTLGEFVVRFFGQYDYYWVNRGRVFPFQEGDTGKISSQKSKIDEAFTMAIEHAQRACEILKSARPNEEECHDIASSLLPPHYVKLRANKPCGALAGWRADADTDSYTQCDCEPRQPRPCGAASQCLNRMLLTECGPWCKAGDRCENRAFEKRQYPKLVPYRTPQRGWGLKTLEDIKQGQFVIEYVGELIDEEEFKRRMRRMHEMRDENFYFLTLDKERMIDAGPKGNLARFMNHCCEPNCETQKWTVLGDVRVGLFALYDIPANSEVTFNYNLECAGIDKKACMCGAKRCSGYIGAKPKQEEPQPKKLKAPMKRTYNKKKKTENSPSTSINKKPSKPRQTLRSKPRELTEIEKDLLIIKNATKGFSSDSECSGRLSSIESEKRPSKRKRVSFSTEEITYNGETEPCVKKSKVDEEKSSENEV